MATFLGREDKEVYSTRARLRIAAPGDGHIPGEGLWLAYQQGVHLRDTAVPAGQRVG